MFDRITANCHRTGLHVAKTRRLWVISSRADDLAHHVFFQADEAARHWQGWWPEEEPPAPAERLARPPADTTGALTPVVEMLYFTAVERRTRIPVAGVSITAAEDGAHHIGGSVHLVHRGRGYGREIMTTACRLAHRHFGIATLHAGCEVTNTASMRWLAGCGFAPDGPTRPHLLPNRREIDSQWWTRTDRRARRRCAHLRTLQEATQLAASLAAAAQPRGPVAHQRPTGPGANLRPPAPGR
ncbi:GNAT family N-acetyltransferase [Catellatospora paridis]|uniref:GNAT family N-acetyltransferase n=1 Tax=Catellatospora paridis TaxID=1617086 RepID=UPI0018AF6867|nr:GNAT family protein [Catellatospora paridis]